MIMLDINFSNSLTTDYFDPYLKHLREQKVQLMYKGKKCTGILWFAGINPLHGQYQVTLGRTPLWPVDPASIKLCDEKPKIFK